MKLNTLLLTSAATLMATSVAFSADLPSKKAAPSSGSVQVCKIAGQTGFQMPGSDTCVSLSGYFYAMVGMASGSGSFELDDASDAYATKMRGQLNIDALSNTEMGVLKSHLSFRYTKYGNNQASSDYHSAIPGDSGLAIDSMYLQLGGLKAGIYDSTFSMLDGAPSLQASGVTPWNPGIMQIGYSAALGNGLTLGVALEDRVPTLGGPATDEEESKQMPDIVGTMDFQTGNMLFHVAGAYHSLNGYDVGDTFDYGYALDAGVTFKLDSLAKGDELSFEYTYTNGDVARLSNHTNDFWGAGSIGGYDTFVDATWNDTTTSHSYAGTFHHVFSNKLSADLYAGYQTVTQEDADVSSTLVGATFNYQPVKHFTISPEVFHVSGKVSANNGSTSMNESGSYTAAMLRIKRDF